VDQRERWQALQSHLTAARGCLDAGDRTKALEAVDAALAIDADFLAAHSLRDRILALPEDGHTDPPLQEGGQTGPPSRPIVSADGYAKFEARAKRRRVDRRLDAAHSAIERRRLKQAAAALDEIIELDPNLPELSELTASFDDLRRAAASRHRGPWIAAAATFAIVLFGATWLQETRPLASHRFAGISALVEPASTTPLVEMAIVDVAVAADTSGTRDSGVGIRQSDTETSAIRERETTGIRDSGLATRAETTATVDAIRNASAEPPGIPTPEPARIANPEPVRIPTAEPLRLANPEPVRAPNPEPLRIPNPESRIPSSESPRIPNPESRITSQTDEVGLVKQTLQRYRSAYDGLDATSAQVVYPAVNQTALARAFDGLESQTLTFDSCDVELRGEAATATCHGSARYVPKVGSREPRTEPRTWNFTLHKAGSDWKIDSARAER
jgi:hypothetical protein